MSIESVMLSSHLILCRPLLLLPPIPANIRVFSNESTLPMRWPKYWSFSFSIIPSKVPRAYLLQNGLVGSPCSPRDSQESSPTKYWSFSFSIIPSKEIPGLISFWMDCLDLLVVQGTLKSLLQYHSSKASILQYSAFFTVQLSHPYMTTGKTIALTRRTLVGKAMSLL